MSRGDGGRFRKAIMLSALIHGGIVALVWIGAMRTERLPPMRIYAVNIVSPPPQASGDPSPEPEPAVTEPEETEPEAEPEPEPEPTPPAPPPPAPPQRTEPEPRPEPPPQQRPEPPAAREPEPEPPRQPTPSTGDRPDPSSAGGADVDLQLQGVQCPTPGYCDNIILQINRYFRSPGRGAAGEADVYFVINRNGTVSDLRIVSSTGGAALRLAVMEAVEQAGMNRAFGPLPGAYQSDRLPVSFYFRPAR
ncbi:MAG: energy transducer TonB [Gemmatimonadota bacterium]